MTANRLLVKINFLSNHKTSIFEKLDMDISQLDLAQGHERGACTENKIHSTNNSGLPTLKYSYRNTISCNI